MTTSATASAAFVVALTLVLDDSGNVDWTASEDSVRLAIESSANESREIREDVVKVLQKYPMEFINEDVVLDKVVSRRAQQKASSLRSRDEDYTADTFEFSLAETSAMRAKVSEFIAANKPAKDTDDDGSSLLISSRGRGGGLQLRGNATTILSKRKADKGPKKLD